MRLKSLSLLKAFDDPSRFVEAFVEAIWLFSAASVGYDRVRSTVLQLHAQLGAVICFVANQVFRCFASAGEALGRRAVVCFASGQQDGEFAAFDLWRPTASEGAGNFVASMAKRQDISVAEVEKQFFEKIRPHLAPQTL